MRKASPRSGVFALLCLGLFLLVFVPSAPGGQAVTLGWNISSDSTVVGYCVYYGGASGFYTNKCDVGTNNSLVVSGLASGSTYYFTATSYNAAGMESAFAPEVSYDLLAPSGFSGLLTNGVATYGSTDITFSGTVSAPGPIFPAAGEAVTVTINGNAQATVIDDFLGDFSLNYDLSASPVIPASGTPYLVTYSYGGDASLGSASDSTTTLTVQPAPVSIASGISANSRAYDGTLAATVSSNAVVLNGVLPNDAASVALSTNGYTAAFASSGAARGVAVTLNGLTLDGSAAGNYELVMPAGLTANITQAQPVISVVSSANPAGFKAAVMFTANVLTNGIPAGDAGGTIQFRTNAVALGSPLPLAGSPVATSLSCLPRGTNVIAVVYSGDGNYQGGSGSLDQVITNHPPVVNTYTVSRSAGLVLHLFWGKVATNWTDLDGDPVNEAAISLETTNDVTIQTNSTQILYPASAPNLNDQIKYEVTDGQGGTNIGLINVVVNPFTTGQAPSSIVTEAGGVTASFWGIPGYTYEVLRSTNMASGTGWVNIATNQADVSGLFRVTDRFTDLGGNAPASAYYELEWHP